MKFVAKNATIEQRTNLNSQQRVEVKSSSNKKDEDHQCNICQQKANKQQGNKKTDKIYVKAGFIGGSGTKDRPFGSLSQVQNNRNWKTVVIYYSSLPLDGGISLRDGQRIVGKGLDKPIITNSKNSTTNNGYGIIVENGSVCIKNIHVDSTQNSGINYDAAINITLTDVEVTNANQASLIVPIGNNFNLTGSNNAETASIQGQNSNDGVTRLVRVTVTDNFTGPGLYDAPYGGAKRWLYVLDSEFARLKTVLAPSAPVFMVGVTAILASAFEAGTKHYVTLKGNHIHDFALSPNSAFAYGINVGSFNGAKGYYNIKKNNIYGLITATNGVGNASYINGTTATLLTDTGSEYSKSTAKISNNILTHVPFPAVYYDGDGVEWSTFNGESKVTIKKNLLQNFFNDVQTIHGAKANTEVNIIENFATAGNSFYTFSTAIFPPEPTDQVFLNNKVSINNNQFNGGNAAGAISTSGQFNRCIVEMKANCFDGTYHGNTGTAIITSSPPGPSGVQFIGHYNNFTNYALDINDLGGNSTYYLQKNWWGSTSGATHNVPPATSVINVNSPLKQPIICQLTATCNDEATNQDQRQLATAKYKPMGEESKIVETISTNKNLTNNNLTNDIRINPRELQLRTNDLIAYFESIKQKVINRW